MKKHILLAVIFIALTSLSNLFGQTDIAGGDVSGVWKKSNSPYIIKGTINIAAGDTLIIEPGTEIKFDGFYSFDISGMLIAEGNTDNYITFSSNATEPTPGDWGGIYFGSECNVTFCIFEYAGQPFPPINNVAVRIASNMTFSYNVIRYNNVSAVGTWGGRRPTISYNLIHDNKTDYNTGAGIYTQNSNAHIFNNTIINNNFNGIWAQGNSGNHRIFNNIIANNADFSIKFDDGGDEPPYFEYNNLWGNAEIAEGLEPSATNISVDPLFESTENYSLSKESPCLDAGDPANTKDSDGTNNEIGWFYYNQLWAVPDSVVFGEVQSGESAVLSFTIEGRLIDEEITITSDNNAFALSFGAEGAWEESLTIAQTEAVDGEISEEVFVRFTPDTDTAYNGVISVLSDDKYIELSTKGTMPAKEQKPIDITIGGDNWSKAILGETITKYVEFITEDASSTVFVELPEGATYTLDDAEVSGKLSFEPVDGVVNKKFTITYEVKETNKLDNILIYTEDKYINSLVPLKVTYTIEKEAEINISKTDFYFIIDETEILSSIQEITITGKDLADSVKVTVSENALVSLDRSPFTAMTDFYIGSSEDGIIEKTIYLRLKFTDNELLSESVTFSGGGLQTTAHLYSVEKTVSTNKTETGSFMIYPTAVHKTVTVKGDALTGKQINLTNEKGVVVHSIIATSGKEQIQLPDTPSKTLFISVLSEGKVIMQQAVVKQ